ncbi:BCCT family transporter [Lutimonas sp.]|uniref:BCCT family transporter n=1 Tax=Lutimonas sp. TaxID=1872403 RepID=UPI003D9BA137
MNSPKNQLQTYKLLGLSILSLFLFSLWIISNPLNAITQISNLSVWVREYFGQFYLILGLGCVLLLVILAMLPVGRQKLGKKDDTPEYNLWSWSAMLFSAGMGAGLILRAVQEPVFMFNNPPIQTAEDNQTLALEYTFYHWGFTPWAMYGLFALIIGFYIYVHKEPVLLSAPVKRINSNSYLLKGIDVLTILVTVIGVIAAVALGVTQITGGLNHLIPELDFQLKGTIGILLTISAISLLSASYGVNKGINVISKINILIALFLLLFVFLQGDIWLMIQRFASTLYHYFTDFIYLSLAIGQYDPGKEFLSSWTYFYWAFWLSWAPFTGIFIARISRGRTIREFVIAILLIPSLGTFFWFTAFGENAFLRLEHWTNYNNEFGNVFTSIFVFFEVYPFQTLINSLVVLVLFTFLITSMDSAIYVLSMFSDDGNRSPSKRHRYIWGVFLPVFGCSLLLLGNKLANLDLLGAMTKLIVITSLPYAFLTIVISLVFIKSLISSKNSSQFR